MGWESVNVRRTERINLGLLALIWSVLSWWPSAEQLTANLVRRELGINRTDLRDCNWEQMKLLVGDEKRHWERSKVCPRP